MAMPSRRHNARHFGSHFWHPTWRLRSHRADRRRRHGAGVPSDGHDAGPTDCDQDPAGRVRFGSRPHGAVRARSEDARVAESFAALPAGSTRLRSGRRTAHASSFPAIGRPRGPVHEGCRRCDAGAAVYHSSVLFKYPNGWSHDGKEIVFHQIDADALENLYVLPTSGEITPKAYVAGPGSDMNGTISADGKWMAYLSDDSGRLEVYVQSFPAPGRRVRISTAGGGWSWWTRESRHIVYLDQRKMSLMIADVEPGETLKAGTPRVMASLPPGVVTAARDNVCARGPCTPPCSLSRSDRAACRRAFAA